MRLDNSIRLMFQKMQEKKIAWPKFSEQEMVDLLVYIQNLPESRSSQAAFVPADFRQGQTLFETKGCRNCHTIGTPEANKINLLPPGRPWLSMVGFTAAMWNHAPQMHARGQVPEFSGEEMNHVIGYLFWTRFFQESGNARRGRRVFERKQCASCHEQKAFPGAPDLASYQGRATPISLMSALWKHGPKMLEATEQTHKIWPQFSGTEMADLIAYLNRRP